MSRFCSLECKVFSFSVFYKLKFIVNTAGKFIFFEMYSYSDLIKWLLFVIIHSLFPTMSWALGCSS